MNLESSFNNTSVLEIQDTSLTSARLRNVAIQALSRSQHFRSNVRSPSELGPIRIGQFSPSLQQLNPNIHPQFRSKAVCILYCSHCSTKLCQRGMRAILLGNSNVELFSTDRQPGGVALVEQDYQTRNCS
jgi:hypothetical protein